MTLAYCTPDDVFQLALSAQAFKTLARPLDGIDGPSGTIRLKAHGFAASDSITFEVTSGGALPTGLSAFVAYSPIPVSSDLFRVTGFPSYVSGGSGGGVAIDPTRRLAAHILEASSEIDQHLTANAPPLVAPFPQVIIGLTARMAARAAILSLSVENAAYRVAVDRLFERQAKDQEMLAQFRDGWPINPRPVDQTVIPENGARASATRGPIGWTNGGCL
jgi:hypothetical protein